MRINNTITIRKTAEKHTISQNNKFSQLKKIDNCSFGNKIGVGKKVAISSAAIFSSLSILLSGCTKAAKEIDLKTSFMANPKIAEMFNSPQENSLKIGKFYIIKGMADSPAEFEKNVNLQMKEFFKNDKIDNNFTRKYTYETPLGEKKIQKNSLEYKCVDAYNKYEITEEFENIEPHIEWCNAKKIKDKKTKEVIGEEFSNATIGIYGKLKKSTKKFLGVKYY